MEHWSQLAGKVVLVTGASSGLGREFCLDLAKAGCRIIAAARRVDNLKSLSEEIAKMNDVRKEHNIFTKVAIVKLDVTSDNNVIAEAIEKAWNAFGYIDALVNNAGCIINISSVSGLNRVQTHGGAAYCSSKAALHTLTMVISTKSTINDLRGNGRIDFAR